MRWLPLSESKVRTQDLFNQIAAVYARRVLTRARAQVCPEVEWMNPQPEDRVLDLACGPGTLGLELARRVRAVYGFDLAEAMIAQGQRAARNGRCATIHFAVADAEQLPLPGNNFDLVTCGYSLATFPAPQQLVQEIVRVARPGGRIAILETVAPENPRQRESLNRLERLRSGAPTRILSLSDLLALFSQANLHLLDGHVHRQPQWEGDWLTLGSGGDKGGERRHLQQSLRQAVRNDGCGLRIRRQRGRWMLYHTVARLLWRK